jgi:pyrophosphate--fructose-6-phosphate 1-phosphotransferase
MLGRSVDKIRTPAELAAALAAATELRLDGLVLLGGTYTQTDAAYLAEAFLAAKSRCRVVGVPATIDGDLKGGAVEATLGFDTACKITAALVGNLETDCLSAKKYVYFARVLGRERGHVALEVALQTRPNVVLLGEDVAERRMTLMDVVRELADGISQRAEAGKNFAVVLVPEGLVSYIPELRTLMAEINAAHGGGGPAPTRAAVEAALSPWSAAVLAALPPAVAAQLFLERESSGETQLSQVSTEKLLLELVSKELARRRVAAPALKAKGANCMGFFFGYQARSALPSNFDCALGAALGHTAVHLLAAGRTGYLAAVRNLAAPPAEWAPVGVPLASLLTVPLPGITCAAAARPSVVATPVDVRGAAFRAFRAASAAWCTGDKYANPGPIQFGGPCAMLPTMTLEAEAQEGRKA